MIGPLIESKNSYGPLYKMSFYDIDYDVPSIAIFSTAKWGEFKNIRDTYFSHPNLEYDIYEYLFKKFVIEYNGIGGTKYSDDESEYLYEGIPAGTVYTVGKSILKTSGPLSAEDMFEDLESIRTYMPLLPEEQLIKMSIKTSNLDTVNINDMFWVDILREILYTENIISGNVPEAPFRLITNEDNNKIDFDKENKSLDEF